MQNATKHSFDIKPVATLVNDSPKDKTNGFINK